MSTRKKRLAKQLPPEGVGKGFDSRNAGRPNSKRSKRVSREVAEPTNASNVNFRWSAKKLDHQFAGEWDWKLLAAETSQVLRFLEELQALTWGEIEAQTYNGKRQKRFKKHHLTPVEKLCADAKKRLLEHYADEEVPESLFRFRLGSTIRLWGERRGTVFDLIWFDRNHRVYPFDD